MNKCPKCKLPQKGIYRSQYFGYDLSKNKKAFKTIRNKLENIMGALNNAIPFSLIVWGQPRIDSGVASILNATTPIFTVLLAHTLTSDERLTLRKCVVGHISYSY